MNDSVDAEMVRMAYLFLLGRAPEDEAAIKSKLECKNLNELRAVILRSNEFRNKFAHLISAKSKWVSADVHDGLTIWLDLHDRYVSNGCLNNNWEPNETQLFLASLRSGQVVLDIGANIGWYSLLAAKHIGVNGVVHAFEPRPDIARMLRRSVSDNNLLDNIIVWEYALSDRNEYIELAWNTSEANPGHSFIRRRTSENDFSGDATDIISTRVKAVRLDDILPTICPDLIKIDVEGAEPMVMSGASKALARRKPLVISELYPAQLAQVSGVSCQDYISQMSSWGYACYLLEGGKPGKRLRDFPDDVGRDLVGVVFEWIGN